eukprot:3095757-Prorocentrum_lima.AAC.1
MLVLQGPAGSHRRVVPCKIHRETQLWELVEHMPRARPSVHVWRRHSSAAVPIAWGHHHGRAMRSGVARDNDACF